jgi:hypothetical protein
MNPKWDRHSFAEVLSMPGSHPLRGVGRYSEDEISARSGKPFCFSDKPEPDNVFRCPALDIVARCAAQSKAIMCGIGDILSVCHGALLCYTVRYCSNLWKSF